MYCLLLKFGVRDVHIMLLMLSIGEFYKNRCRTGHNFLTGKGNYIYMYAGKLWLSGSEECVGTLCALCNRYTFCSLVIVKRKYTEVIHNAVPLIKGSLKFGSQIISLFWYYGFQERHRTKQLLAQQEILFPRLFWSLRSALHPLLSFRHTGEESRAYTRHKKQSQSHGLQPNSDELSSETDEEPVL